MKIWAILVLLLVLMSYAQDDCVSKYCASAATCLPPTPCGIPPDCTPTETYYYDSDRDTFGNPDLEHMECPEMAENIDGLVDNNDDCDDTDPKVYPNAQEVCDNKDNDCDGLVDEGCDDDKDSYADSDISCEFYFKDGNNVTRSCIYYSGDCNDQVFSIHPNAPELCDGVDNDCDTTTVEEALTFFIDNDNDGYGTNEETVTACTMPSGFADNDDDCDDTDPDIHPGAPELCDGINNDCDDLIDEGIDMPLFFLDADDDGFGNPEVHVQECTAPDGYVDNDEDCNDDDLDINPEAEEICDSIDNNCNNMIDEGLSVSLFYRDRDQDTYGNNTNTRYACKLPTGYVSRGNDCDDSNPRRFPGAVEICDALDNNCNGIKDEGCDDDRDGYADADMACPEVFIDGNYVRKPCQYFRNDCDDENASINPISPELCDGVDNNCNDRIDENVTITFFYDSDGDSFGDSSISVKACAVPVNYVLLEGDCNDQNRNIFPGAVELCDQTDNNCDGTVDEGCGCIAGQTITCSRNEGVCEGYVVLCQPDGVVPVCNYSTLPDYERVEETCDGIDNDCDSLVDEGCDQDYDGFINPDMLCSNCTYDCDDNQENVFPGNPELCDGLDNNCDGIVDNTDEEVYCHELIADYRNIGVCKDQKAICGSNGWYCPLEEFRSEEICDDNLDNNCNGRIDEGCGCISGDTKSCGSDEGECTQGIQTCIDGYWSDCQESKDPSPEVCDNLDNDCDGKIDESLVENCFVQCEGTRTCVKGQWEPCKTTCDTQIQVELDSTDFGRFHLEGRITQSELKKGVETLKVVNQTIKYTYSQETTLITNQVKTTNKLEDVEYVLYIPKCLSPYLDAIEFENKDYKIIQEDPIIAWHFASVNDNIDLSYEVRGRIPQECLQQIKGMPVAELIGAELRSNNYNLILPLILVFIVVMFVIFKKSAPHEVLEPEQDLIIKQKNKLLKRIKDMKFKTKEQAKHHMEGLGISDDLIEWILKKL